MGPSISIRKTNTMNTSETHDIYKPGIRVIDGHPVPYSATVQRQRKDNNDWESFPCIRAIDLIDDWMKAHRPDQKILRTEEAYFFYGEPPKPGTDMVRLVNVMMDVVSGNISTGKAREILRNEGYPGAVWQQVLAPLQE